MPFPSQVLWDERFCRPCRDSRILPIPEIPSAEALGYYRAEDAKTDLFRLPGGSAASVFPELLGYLRDEIPNLRIVEWFTMVFPSGSRYIHWLMLTLASGLPGDSASVKLQ